MPIRSLSTLSLSSKSGVIKERRFELSTVPSSQAWRIACALKADIRMQQEFFFPLDATGESEVQQVIEDYAKYIKSQPHDSIGVEVAREDEEVAKLFRFVGRLERKILDGNEALPQRLAAFKSVLMVFNLIESRSHGSDNLPFVYLGRSTTNVSTTLELEFGLTLSFLGKSNLSQNERAAFRAIIVEAENQGKVDHFLFDVVSGDGEESGKLWYLYTDDEFSLLRGRNRVSVERVLNDHDGSLTVDFVDEVFRTLTQDCFPKLMQSFRTPGRAVIFAGFQTGSPLVELKNDVETWCNDANALINSDVSNYQYLLALAPLVARLAEIHPFPDWNGTMAMYLALYISKQRFPDKKVTFMPNNKEMLKYIFNNNVLALRKFALEMKSRGNSDFTFSEIVVKHIISRLSKKIRSLLKGT